LHDIEQHLLLGAQQTLLARINTRLGRLRLVHRAKATDQRLSELNLGPGKKETLSLSLALPPSPNPQRKHMP
jgi:ABC-type siderophore export system fused ATPase/permease subunit